jgi:gamma-glutamylcyclotransferase (GGCT)/AIG2-like uncharacterized protein YtfP
MHELSQRMPTVKIFVYGSLMKGMALSPNMAGTCFLGKASISAELYLIEDYPGIIPGNNIVLGELYEVPLSVLYQLDKIEEFDPNNPSNSLFIRKEIEATTIPGNKKTISFVYYYNKSTHNKPIITTGDYRAYLSSGQENPNAL